LVALSPKTPGSCHPISYRNHQVIYLSFEIMHLYEVIQYTCATLRNLLLHRVVASLKRRHTTPSTVAQGANQNAGTTPSNLPVINVIVVKSYIYMKSYITYHTFV
jgi:hypothetical protein